MTPPRQHWPTSSGTETRLTDPLQHIPLDMGVKVGPTMSTDTGGGQAVGDCSINLRED